MRIYAFFLSKRTVPTYLARALALSDTVIYTINECERVTPFGSSGTRVGAGVVTGAGVGESVYGEER